MGLAQLLTINALHIRLSGSLPVAHACLCVHTPWPVEALLLLLLLLLSALLAGGNVLSCSERSGIFRIVVPGRQQRSDKSQQQHQQLLDQAPAKNEAAPRARQHHGSSIHTTSMSRTRETVLKVQLPHQWTAIKQRLRKCTILNHSCTCFPVHTLALAVRRQPLALLQQQRRQRLHLLHHDRQQQAAARRRPAAPQLRVAPASGQVQVEAVAGWRARGAAGPMLTSGTAPGRQPVAQ